jgi:hypothetical protein
MLSEHTPHTVERGEEVDGGGGVLASRAMAFSTVALSAPPLDAAENYTVGGGNTYGRRATDRHVPDGFCDVIGVVEIHIMLFPRQQPLVQHPDVVVVPFN